ncbi:type VI secretion system contractile sheath large subunit [Serratia aquatilis]|uniref:Type VI secretion system contractile sheath large subunit n=1 Tax=Serratia aquatilis TaxID=1737515 RepID=A0ABV6EHK7_9GAMM
MATLDTLQMDANTCRQGTSLCSWLLASLNGSEYSLNARDIALLLRTLPEQGRGVTLSIMLIDRLLRELDQRLSEQMDAILHAPLFQRIESSWRALALLVDNIPFNENIQLTLLHATKEELLADFEFSSEITTSGYYRHVYEAGYGQFGGVPVAAVIGAYDFTPGVADIKLLRFLSVVSSMAHAPFLSAADATFFGVDSLADLPSIRDLDAVMSSPTHIRWQALRAFPDARYLGLTVCKFLLREPYTQTSNRVRQFTYQENVGSHHHLLWGNSAFLLATCLAGSFARYRWCPNIIGADSGGAIRNLPAHYYSALGRWQEKIPTEVLLSDQWQYSLSMAGFIPLGVRKKGQDVVFYSANSVQLAESAGLTPEAKVNQQLGTQLPYLFIITRLAHTIKVLQRERLGGWKNRGDLQYQLNTWLKRFVSDQDNPPASVRSRRPLRAARIEVQEVDNDPGWYLTQLHVQPHFKHMGSNFVLALTGRLDK